MYCNVQTNDLRPILYTYYTQTFENIFVSNVCNTVYTYNSVCIQVCNNTLQTMCIYSNMDKTR